MFSYEVALKLLSIFTDIRTRNYCGRAFIKMDLYHKFNEIDGSHPLKEANREGVVEYQARRRKGGKVIYFNFPLAKIMGLIPENHEPTLRKILEKRILETFSLVIINEYDLLNNVDIPPKEILPNTFIATRYLQLQHPNKQGKTSGDGRSIWNGQIRHKAYVWDISSCGTGATRLSPATNIHNKYFKTGDPAISYGCGYSELEEGFETLFFSEVLHENHIRTERVLAIIEFDNGYTINVRAHHNLLRPSHFFMYIKQKQYVPLKMLTDYYIERELTAGRMLKAGSTKKQYKIFLETIANSFAEMAAKFEDEYIFCWMDWDGDNILMDGGIIDYGSIRQFGLFHSEYRFDDIHRYSTSIKEQKKKARYTVQTFSQIYEYLIKGIKHNINALNKHWAVKIYDKRFDHHKDRNILYKIGFNKQQIEHLLEQHRQEIRNFRRDFSYFERCKSEIGPHEVADGINHSAIFCMRDILRELPQLYLVGHTKLTNDEFIEIIKSTYATDSDLKVNSYRDNKIKSFQKHYWRLIEAVRNKSNASREKVLSTVSMRSAVINKYDRVTGDSICNIANKVIKHKPRLSPEDINAVLEYFVHYQNLDPDDIKTIRIKSKYKKLLMTLVSLVKDLREGL